jgi:hypothetical protein
MSDNGSRRSAAAARGTGLGGGTRRSLKGTGPLSMMLDHGC